MFAKVMQKQMVSQEQEALSAKEVAKNVAGVGEKILRQRMAILLGGMSAFLYMLLYMFSDKLVELAQITHQGNHHYFYVPVVIALVFSFVHGAFTSHFWDAMGIKPKQQAQ